MILPQSSSFKVLKRRLNCASRIASFGFLFENIGDELISEDDGNDPNAPNSLVLLDPYLSRLDEHMKIFNEAQEKKERYRHETMEKERIASLKSSLDLNFLLKK